ncbi:hypothetical protein FCOIX_2657 [Fusarium coicis]|nr:hypothetical protein FCOIX_2657 [Fusarium coicis]
MQLINLSALALFATSALAADCFGNRQDGIEKFEQAYWDARQKMCSNSDCAYQQGCTTRGSKTLKGLASITVNVELSRKNTGGKKGFKDCWDATENIINQVTAEGGLNTSDVNPASVANESGAWDHN